MSRNILVTRIVVLLMIALLVLPSGGIFNWPVMHARADPPEMWRNETVPEKLSSYASDEPILIWDNDGGDTPDGMNGSEQFINRSLLALGYTNVTVTGQGDNITLYNLSNYTAVFALFGMSPVTGNITPPEENALTDFLDDDGRLYVEGGDVGFQAADNAGSGEFASLWPYLKANYISNGNAYDLVNGTAPFLTGDMRFNYTGNNASMDVLSPAAGAFGMFNSSTNTLGIGHNGTYRTVLFSFQFGGLENTTPTNSRDHLMERIIHLFSYFRIRDVAILGENFQSPPCNFEGNSDEGWTHSPVQGNLDVWQRGRPANVGPQAAHEGNNVWGTDLVGNYPDVAEFALYLPTVVIGTNSNLTFWHWYDIEVFFDYGNVEIFDTAANRWRVLASFDGRSGGWIKESVSLFGFSGVVNIRFLFHSDININFAGWYIDEVQLWSDNASLPLTMERLFEHGDGYFGGNEMEIEPNATVENTGNTDISFDLRARVYFQSNDTEVYNHSIRVNLTEGERRGVGFPTPWNTSTLKNVTYMMEFRSFAMEENGTGTDNVTTFWIYVGSFLDLRTASVDFNSPEPLLPGTAVNLTGDFENLGNVNITNFTASLKITNAQSSVVYWHNVSGVSLNLSWGNTTTVTFPDWNVPNNEGDYIFNLSHNLSDRDNSNNHFERNVLAEEFYDISPVAFHFNVSQPLNTSKIISVVANVTNWGNINSTNASLRCTVSNRTGTEIFNQTNSSFSVMLPTGNTSKVVFQNLSLPSEEGNISVVFDVLWQDDENATNDHFEGQASIDDHHDVGVLSYDSIEIDGATTYGYYRKGMHQITTGITNYGNVNETPSLEIEYRKADTLFYDNVEGQSTWHNIALQGPAQFHVVQPTSPHNDHHSPGRSWWFGDENTGNYADGSVNVLVTKVNLTNRTMALFKFWQYYTLANDNTDFSCVVYNETMINNPQQADYFIYGDMMTGTNGGWEEAVYDLSQFCGREILIGFGIVTDFGGNPTVDKGWYIDDISIIAPNSSNADTQIVNCQEIAPGENASIVDNYDFQENASYFVSPRTVIDGDENSVNNAGGQVFHIRDFPDPAVTDLRMTNARPTYSFNDLEDDDGGFIASGQNSFQWGTPQVPGGPVLQGQNTKCWAVDLTNPYRDRLDISLTGRLDIKNFTGAILSFEHWYCFERFNDGLWLEIKNASDNRFVNLTPMGGYPDVIIAPNGWPNGGAQFPGFSMDNVSNPQFRPQWKTVRFNLTRYAGNAIDIRFRFISDITTRRAGWFMDDLTLYDPTGDVRYRVNMNENCDFSFDMTNLGNIPTSGGTAELEIRGITNPQYTFSDSINLANLAVGGVSTRIFPTTWTVPNDEGFYEVKVALTTPNDINEGNSNLTFNVEVQDEHNIRAAGIISPTVYNAYAMGSTIQLQGRIRNVGTHGETGITVNATIVDVDNESWAPVTFTTTIDLPLKTSKIISFEWDIPERLGAEYRITFEAGHPIDENSSDNAYHISFFALPEDMVSAAFGFAKDNDTDSPFYGLAMPNITVELKAKGTFNPLFTTTTDENGFYSMDLSSINPGLDYVIKLSREWYYAGIFEFHLRPNIVYKGNIGMIVDNLNPRAVLTLPIETPYYVLAGDEMEYLFSDSWDSDNPAQKFTYVLESDISGILYEGPNASANCSLESGVHEITLTVMDEMGGEDNTTVEVTSYNASWKTINFGEGLLTMDLLSAGPGTVKISSENTVDLPDNLLDIGYSFNLRSDGVIFVLTSVVTIHYDDEDLHRSIMEENIRLYRYDHLYPEAAWEMVAPFVIDELNNTISVTLTGKNRSWDIDLVPLAIKDREPPTVTATLPEDGMVGVDVFTGISITFSENILFSQIKRDDISIEAGLDRMDVYDYWVEYNETTYNLSITLKSGKLESKKLYTITLENVFDLMYNRMGTFYFSFRTEAWEQDTEVVAGFVKDVNSYPIPGAKIIIDDNVMAVTDDNGYYAFSIEAGTYNIIVNRSGYFDMVAEDVVIVIGRPVTESFVIKTYVFSETTHVSGRVKDDANNPIVNIQVKCDGRVMDQTDMNGEFEFFTSRGTHGIAVSKAGYVPYLKDLIFGNASHDLGEITLRRMDFGIITGKVMDGKGIGIEGVTIHFKVKEVVKEEVITDAKGDYSVELDPGVYVMYLSHEEYDEKSFPGVKVMEGDLLGEDFLLQEKEKKNKEDDPASGALGLVSPIIFIIVIVIVIALIFFVIRRPVGRTPPDDDGEGSISEKDMGEPSSIIPTEPEGPPGEMEGPPGRIVSIPLPITEEVGVDDSGQVPTASIESAPVAQLPEMEKRSSLGSGSKDMLALPPGPEGDVGTDVRTATEATGTTSIQETPEKIPKTPAEASEPEISDAAETPPTSPSVGDPSPVASKTPQTQQRKIVRRKVVKKVMKK